MYITLNGTQIIEILADDYDGGIPLDATKLSPEQEQQIKNAENPLDFEFINNELIENKDINIALYKLIKIDELRSFTNETILRQYPSWKQVNITGGINSTAEDLTNMKISIESKIAEHDAKKAEIEAAKKYLKGAKNVKLYDTDINSYNLPITEYDQMKADLLSKKRSPKTRNRKRTRR